MVQPDVISYRRSRFSTRLPVDRVYTPAHFWLFDEGQGAWRIGFTKFAARMLGDLVELKLDAKAGEPVTLGQQIGWVEGFKAVTDLYCVATGEFMGANPALADDITLADSDPYGKGWLYRVRGQADQNGFDVQGYIQMLDLAIDKMQSKSGSGDANGDAACPV